MIAISLFYILFLFLLILIIFLILLYSGYHSRTLAPPLLDSFYGFTTTGGSSIPTTFSPLYLNDGENIEGSALGVSGGIDFGASGTSLNAGKMEFAFRPMLDDRQRKLKGNITLLMNSNNIDGENIELQLKDENDNNHIVSGPTKYFIDSATKGPQEVKLYFNSRNLSAANHHRFILEGKGTLGGISANTLLLNSAYLYYY